MAEFLPGSREPLSLTSPIAGTNLNSYNGFKDPREGAKALIKAATDTKENVHLRVVDENGPEPW